MAKATINQWDGGHTEDPRTFRTNESQSSANIDIYSNPHRMTPFADPVAETISSGSGIMTDFKITDVVPCSFSGTTKLVGWGQESAASAKATFFTKSSPITSDWVSVVTGAGAAPNGSPVAGTLVNYLGNVYALTQQPNLIKFTSGTTFTSVGGAGSQNTNTSVYAKPHVHPVSKYLYWASGDRVICQYDESSINTSAFTGVPTGYTVTSLTSYGAYLAIACKPTSGVGNSIVYLWNLKTTTTLNQGAIDWGDGDLEALENIGGYLVGVSTVKTVGSFDTTTNYSYKIKVWAGGETPTTVKDIITGNSNVLRSFKAVGNDKLYFAFDTDNAVFVVGKNRSGNWYVAKDRYYTPSGSTITGTVNGISIVGDILWVAYTDGGTVGYLTRTSDSTFAATSVYTTTINPGMSTDDRYENKKLVAIQVAYSVTTSGNVTINYVCDGSSEEIINVSKSSTGEYRTTSTNTTSGKPFLTGTEFYFTITTTGYTRIKEIKYVYEKLASI